MSKLLTHNKQRPLTDVTGEVRELTVEDFAQAKPLKTANPALFSALKTAQKNRRGRPVSDAPKQAVTIRLSPEILAFFKRGGKGWQTRINQTLLDYVSEHK